MDSINYFFQILSSFLWGWPMIVLLLGTHVFLTIRLRVPQRKLFTGIRLSVQKDKGAKGDVSQFGALATKRDNIVYMLWGGFARSKAGMIDRTRNLVLESVHPSPLSANRGGWFGQHHFSRCNAYLQEHGITPIIW